jgi:hypothetical protein
VFEHDGRSALSGGVLVAPPHQGDEDRVEVDALLAEPVLEPGRVVLVPPPLEDAVLDEPPEAVGQDVAGRAGVPLELLEPPDPEERLPQHQHGPSFADDLERASHGAVLVRKPIAFHDWSVAE